MSAWRGTRRDALRRGAIAAPAVLLGATGTAAAATKSDPELVSAAIVLEQRAVFLYRTGAAADYLDRDFTALAERLEGHAREHVAVLQTILEALGAEAPEPPGGVRGLAEVRTQRQFGDVAVALESELVRGYQSALQTLADPKLVQTVGSILAAAGQHLALLRVRLERDPVPSAFETGR